MINKLLKVKSKTMEHYGFVYLWYDRHRQKFCIGSHYGQLNDGYISSTGNMSKAYAKRPSDFKRRILYYLSIPNYKLLLQREQYFLDKIKDYELGSKYYNLKKHAAGGNGSANKGKNKNAWNKGLSGEMLKLRRQKLFCLLIDKPKRIQFTKCNHTEAGKKAISESTKRSWREGKLKSWNKGKGKPKVLTVQTKRIAWN
jgi:hypothetical protein